MVAGAQPRVIGRSARIEGIAHGAASDEGWAIEELHGARRSTTIYQTPQLRSCRGRL